jgi:carbonic anhydrase
MRRINVRLSCLLLAVVVLAAPAVTVSATEPQTGADKHGEGTPGWDYSTARGPDHWGELSPEYVLARVGGSQSPVDIDTANIIGADLPPLVIEPHAQPLHLLNNGHTVEAICPRAASLQFGALRYELLQFHFHAPSEHTIDGEHAEVELHFVHSDGEGHLAVVAVLFFEGAVEHPEVAELLTRESVSHPGDEIFDAATALDVRDFLPDSLDYYTYDGSLTTPPATEGVRWFVLKQPLHMSRAQIEAIDRVYYSNNRPTQPLNARFVLTRR